MATVFGSSHNTWLSTAVHVNILDVVPVHTHKNIHATHVQYTFHACTDVCIYAHMHIHTHRNTYTQEQTYTTWTHLDTHIQKQTYRNMHTGTHIHMCAHIHTNACTFGMYSTLFMQNK